MSVTARPRGWHAGIASRLQAGDPAALMELYDATSAIVYAYALQTATFGEDACQATHDVYLTVWQAPQLLHDVRVPVEVRLASLVRSTTGSDHLDPVAKAAVGPDEFGCVPEHDRHPVTALSSQLVAGDLAGEVKISR
ncbi:MAG: hypothetical protein ABI047_01260 [Jatrophihabitantaceae bacterium]